MKYSTKNNYTIELSERSAQHLKAHPEVAKYLSEAISISTPESGLFQEIEIDLGRPIGNSGLVSGVQVTSSQPTTFAQRNGRPRPSRVVVGNPGDVTNMLTIVIKPIKPATFVLITAWVGGLAKKEPWDTSIKSASEKLACLNFWCSHALSYKPDLMDEVFQSTWDNVLSMA